jgi:hypothetical protein
MKISEFSFINSTGDIKTFSATYNECELLRRIANEAKTILDAMMQPDAIGHTFEEMGAAYRKMVDLRRRHEEAQTKLNTLL